MDGKIECSVNTSIEFFEKYPLMDLCLIIKGFVNQKNIALYIVKENNIKGFLLTRQELLVLKIMSQGLFQITATAEVQLRYK